MGTIYIFRGKAATGKTVLSNMLAMKLSIPVIRKDNIVDALKTMPNIDKSLVNNAVYYGILQKIIQTNLDLGVDFILDIALGDRTNAKWFYDQLNFHSNTVLSFFTTCSDENEWERRHVERIKNPLPNQSFKSFEHVLEHYANADVNPFDNEYIIDSAAVLDKCFDSIMKIIDERA